MKTKRNHNNLKKKKESSEYIFWKDKKFIGSIALVVTIFLFVISYLEISLLTTIHDYTIGALFGYLSPIFYIFILFLISKIIFGKSWLYSLKFYFSNWSLIILYTILVFLIISIISLIDDSNNLLIWGEKVFINGFKIWWKSFSNQGIHNSTALLPNSSNSGIIGTLVFSIFGSLLTSLGLIILSVFLIAYLIFITFKGPIHSQIKFNPLHKFIKSKNLEIIQEETEVDNYTNTLKMQLKEESQKSNSLIIKDLILPNSNDEKQLNKSQNNDDKLKTFNDSNLLNDKTLKNPKNNSKLLDKSNIELALAKTSRNKNSFSNENEIDNTSDTFDFDPDMFSNTKEKTKLQIINNKINSQTKKEMKTKEIGKTFTFSNTGFLHEEKNTSETNIEAQKKQKNKTKENNKN